MERGRRFRAWFLLGWRSACLWLGCLLVGWGCSKAPDLPAARYPDGESVPVVSAPHQEIPKPTANWVSSSTLSVVESGLSPATLWRSDSNRISFFSGMMSAGLGGPTFLAYSSPTGIAVIRPGDGFAGTEMRENWLLAGFPGAPGWVDWDSPWGLFLQRRPQRVRFDTNGLTCEFSGGAGFISAMPLYGYFKPPQKGREFLSRHGLEEKKLLTWEWSIVVARDPLTRLRYWSGATRRFPVDGEESYSIDRNRDEVTLRTRFRWMEVPDDWGTRPIRIAPVSPVLGLVRSKGQSFPATFSRPPFDYEVPTPFGPFYGIADVDAYEVSFPVLRYLNETEAPVVANESAPPLQRLRSVVRETFAKSEDPLRDGASTADPMRSITAAFWYAQALPYLDDSTRATMVSRLRRFFRDEVLVPGRLVERGSAAPAGERRLFLPVPGRDDRAAVADVGPESSLLQALWAYVHRGDDIGLVRERWPLIRRLWDVGMPTRWAAFGREGGAELGDRASPVAAYARLAFVAGDREAYHRACGVFARELVHLYASQRGVRWFREQQPWHSMEPIDAETYLIDLSGGLTGWRLDGPAYPRAAANHPHSLRWTRFQDVDVARFFRDHLAWDLRQEWDGLRKRYDSSRVGFEDPNETPSLVRWTSWLAPSAMTNLASIASVDALAGPPSGVVAGCLAMLRSAAAPKWERLFPGAPPSEPVPAGTTRQVFGDPALVQQVRGADNESGWPSLEWPAWRTPTGRPWSFGEVRAGAAAGAIQAEPPRWNGLARQTVWRAAP
ncbi:MAG: hypothetical protein JNK85_22315 [Verrucomicrobiales bacterium]|nr:hypothetical protein [Verrucomicrobiales bacterium]